MAVCPHHDRAAVVATVILQMTIDATVFQRDELQAELEAYLRDEFDSLERQVAAERGDPS